MMTKKFLVNFFGKIQCWESVAEILVLLNNCSGRRELVLNVGQNRCFVTESLVIVCCLLSSRNNLYRGEVLVLHVLRFR